MPLTPKCWDQRPAPPPLANVLIFKIYVCVCICVCVHTQASVQMPREARGIRIPNAEVIGSW